MDFSMLMKKLVTITLITANLYLSNVVTLSDIYHATHEHVFIVILSEAHIHDLFLYKNKESIYHRGICYQLKTFKITGTVNNICKI
jgi:hypothetical protein